MSRPPKPPLPTLEAEPERFDFFQAVRLIEGRAAARHRPAVPVGAGSNAADEAVRFKASLASGFPSGDVGGYRPATTPGGKAELSVNFLGLAGAFGPLPTPIAELVQNRRRLRDPEAEAPAEFLDIFNHRLISLMMRVRRSHRLALQPGMPDETAYAQVLLALLGLGTPGLRPAPIDDADRNADRGLLYLAGLLNERPVSLHAVERAVAHHLGVPVRGEPFLGGWLPLPPDQTMVLGRRGRNNRLGTTSLLGCRVWSQSGGIRLVLGPLSLAEFDSLLPTGEAHVRLKRLLGYMLNGEVAVELDLHLVTTEMERWIGKRRRKADEVPGPKAPLRLGAGGLRLGWKSWLLNEAKTKGKPFEARLTLRLGEVA
jgi:type VI secretion system protein ImpH